ncbi:MAG: efflux RND transporter periplasmic adaptor subunit [Vicinamibacteria bacterium]
MMMRTSPPKARRIAALFLAATLASCRAAEVKSAAAAPVPVTVAKARQGDFPIELRAIGSIESPWTVDVRPQVDGAIDAIHFTEGQDVRAGELLFTIDPRPSQAALAVAEANLARDRVQAQNAEAEQKRAADLFAQGVISIDGNDKAAANARALVAGLKADEAAVQTARLRLDYCSIRSPLSGRTGAIMVKAGNLVRALDLNPLVTILQVDSVNVTFTIPESRLSEIKKAGALQVLVRRRGEDAEAAKGALSFVDSAVDRMTGTIRLKARLANASRKLWPGQFVDVSMVLSVRAAAVIVPAPSVQDGQTGPFIFVVSKDMTAEIRPVTTGPSRNGETLIEKGLDPGETVVVDGQVRLTPGARVNAKPAGPAS